MKNSNYEEMRNSINERAASVTRLLADLKAGRDVNFNSLTSLIASGFTNELALLAENETYAIEKEHEELIGEIDVPSFMKK